MEITTGQALSYVASGFLAVGLYHGIGAALDLGINAAIAAHPPKDNPTLPGGSRR